jgi:hypothetical protein
MIERRYFYMNIEELIEQEVLGIMEEAKMLGGSSKEYGTAIDNAIKLTDLQKKRSDIEFDRSYREEREKREWYKAETERLDAQARLADANAKVTVAKYDCAGRVVTGGIGLFGTWLLISCVIAAEQGDIIVPAKLLSLAAGMTRKV